MTEPDRNDPAPAPSEMTNANATSPSDEIRPDSLASQNAPYIEAPPTPLSPMPVLNSIRPPSAGLPGLTPRPSSVPPPRLRPAAPPDSSNNIGPGSGAQPVLTEAEISATQEIAEAISNAQRIEPARVAPTSAQSTTTSARPAVARPRPGARTSDPLFIRRTTIPILLTLGVILAGAAGLLFFGGDDNALPDLFPGWVPIVFCVLAAICASLAVLNMFSVKAAK